MCSISASKLDQTKPTMVHHKQKLKKREEWKNKMFFFEFFSEPVFGSLNKFSPFFSMKIGPIGHTTLLHVLQSNWAASFSLFLEISFLKDLAGLTRFRYLKIKDFQQNVQYLLLLSKENNIFPKKNRTSFCS